MSAPCWRFRQPVHNSRSVHNYCNTVAHKWPSAECRLWHVELLRPISSQVSVSKSRNNRSCKAQGTNIEQRTTTSQRANKNSWDNKGKKKQEGRHKRTSYKERIKRARASTNPFTTSLPFSLLLAVVVFSFFFFFAFGFLVFGFWFLIFGVWCLVCDHASLNGQNPSILKPLVWEQLKGAVPLGWYSAETPLIRYHWLLFPLAQGEREAGQDNSLHQPNSLACVCANNPKQAAAREESL